MRHVLGLLGLVAASALVVVSAAMNWRFGFSLGNTDFDGQVYGLASVAADCLKAIVPFLIIYALKTRKWAQAFAGIALGIICTGYSLTSSLGFAALNRADNNGARLIKVTNYNDTRAELKRLQDKLSWMPKHRPANAVSAELQRANATQIKMRGRKRQTVSAATANCSLTNWVSRKYCPSIFDLKKELAISQEATNIDNRIIKLRSTMSVAGSVAAAGKTDPQADFISSLFGLKLEDTQTVLILLVSLLVEAGSALGLFVVFSMWRMDESQLGHPVRRFPEKEIKAELQEIIPVAQTAAVSVALPGTKAKLLSEQVLEQEEKTEEEKLQSDNDNDHKKIANRITAEAELLEENRDPVLLPKNEMDRYYEERIEKAEGQSTTATQLYDDYCEWCSEQNSSPMSQIPFGKQLSKMEIKKAKIAGRIRYKGIRLIYKSKKGQGQPGAVRVA